MYKRFSQEALKQKVLNEAWCMSICETYHLSYLWELEAGEADDVSEFKDRTQWLLIRVKQTGFEVSWIHTFH